jgi:hypothetical protein
MDCSLIKNLADNKTVKTCTGQIIAHHVVTSAWHKALRVCQEEMNFSAMSIGVVQQSQ